MFSIPDHFDKIEINISPEDYNLDRTIKYNKIKEIYVNNGCGALLTFLVFDRQARDDLRFRNQRNDILKAIENTKTEEGQKRLLTDIIATFEIFCQYIKKALNDDYDFLIDDWLILRIPNDYYERLMETLETGTAYVEAYINDRLIMIPATDDYIDPSEDIMNFQLLHIFETDYEFISYTNIIDVAEGTFGTSYDNKEPVEEQLEKIFLEDIGMSISDFDRLVRDLAQEIYAKKQIRTLFDVDNKEEDNQFVPDIQELSENSMLIDGKLYKYNKETGEWEKVNDTDDML